MRGTFMTAFCFILLAGTAEARVRVSAALEPAGSRSRLVVTIENSRGFTSHTRPRAVRVTYRRTSYRLRRVTLTSASRSARTAKTLWRSSPRVYLNNLHRRRVAVLIRTALRTTRFRRRVVRAPPRFAPPPRDVTGTAAFVRIRKYFINSRITDCPGGWPACATERRYEHCAGGDIEGNWQAREFPVNPLSPARHAPYKVLTAFQRTDGSWGVTYKVTLDANSVGYYSWHVEVSGRATGVYAAEGQADMLRGFTWQPSASC